MNDKYVPRPLILTEENGGLTSSVVGSPTQVLSPNVNTRTIWFTLKRDSLSAITDHVLVGAIVGGQIVPFGTLCAEHPNLFVRAEDVGTLAYGQIGIQAVTNSPDVYVSRSLVCGG